MKQSTDMLASYPATLNLICMLSGLVVRCRFHCEQEEEATRTHWATASHQERRRHEMVPTESMNPLSYKLYLYRHETLPRKRGFLHFVESSRSTEIFYVGG